ncbi:MAG: hypothetical protein JNK90_02875 [Planctomycetaceae bacterium]|nr:hypothetical protein [Planctomycetaceae bacterium]
MSRQIAILAASLLLWSNNGCEKATDKSNPSSATQNEITKENETGNQEIDLPVSGPSGGAMDQNPTPSSKNERQSSEHDATITGDNS